MEPENTIRSFKRAQVLGVDMIEMDVRATKDGELVIFHDQTLVRLFGIRRRVARMTLLELKEISQSREIPTLDEVLVSVSEDLIIEIKVHGIERQVLSKIKKFPHKVMISSFYPKVLEKVRALDGKIELGLLIGYGELHIMPIISRIIKKLNLSFISPNRFLVSSRVIKLLRRSGKKIFVWTVDSEREFNRMMKLGVDGVYTDHAEFIRLYAKSRSL